LKATIDQQAAELTEKDAMIKQLASMEAVHCEIAFVVNNKAVFGSIKNGDYSQVADATLKYLRGELVREDTLIVNRELKY